MISIRDLLLTSAIVGSLPVCFFRPWIGILIWAWFGVMTPHLLVWSFAYGYPFAELIAVATLAGVLFASDRQGLPRTRETYILLGLWALFTITTVFAMYPDESWEQWKKVSKILLFTVLALVFLQDRARLRSLALVLALSIGFFGLKGGLWALMEGGTNRVEAPQGSFIGGNTGLALGLDIALPFFVFLARDERNPWLRRLLWVTFLFSIPAVVFTYSRGGLLGLGAVLALITVKMKKMKWKLTAATVFATIAIALLAVAPPQWFERVDTIGNYEGDMSATGRLMAWGVAFRFALDHPLLGGGFFATAHDDVYLQYTGIEANLVPHSIWFSMLSEHGFPGLILFGSLIISCVLTLRRLRRGTSARPPVSWIVNYSHMLEVSIGGYVVAASFLNAAYMDVFYWVVALVILLDVVATRQLRAPEDTSSAPTPAPMVLERSRGRLIRYHRLRRVQR